MRTRLTVMLVLGLAGALVWSVAGQSGTAATRKVSISAPAFVGREYSVHNRNGGQLNACADFVPLQNGGENLGDLDNSKGSYMAFLRLEQNSTVRKVRLFVNDADADDDVSAYLIRRKIVPGLATTDGYKVMGRAQSSGAVTATIRRFTDDTINGAVVDNNEFAYFIEMIDCGIPEPFAVQVEYSD
jgi:hypothetical protein